ncbi:hypothetical protein ACQJBY_048375 [Aegilops geniculata]
MHEPGALYIAGQATLINLHHIKASPELHYSHGVQGLHPGPALRCSSSSYRSCYWRRRAVPTGGHPRLVGVDGAAGPECAGVQRDGGEHVLVPAGGRGDVLQPRRGERGDPGHDQAPPAQPEARALPHQQRLADLQGQAHNVHLRRQDAARLHPR